MTKILAKFTSIALLILSVSCGSEIDVMSELFGEEDQGKNVIVYCDLSKSIDSLAAQSIIRKVKELYGRFEYKTNFYVYSVNKSRGSEYIIRSETLPELRDVNHTPAEVKRREDEVQSYIDSISSLIQPKLYTTYLNTPSADNSCIVDKLDRATEIFQSLDKSYLNYLFLFSDMVEDCDKSQIGGKNISMEIDHNYESILKDVSSSLNPITTFGDVNFFVIQTTSDENSLSGMSSDNLRNLWNKIFMKYNLSSDSSFVIFNPEIPPEIK